MVTFSCDELLSCCHCRAWAAELAPETWASAQDLICAAQKVWWQQVRAYAPS